MATRVCLNSRCEDAGKRDGENIVGFGSFRTKTGLRMRRRCKACGRTFSENTQTAYVGLRCSRDEFDQVAQMRVEGVSISATARITKRSRNTVARWLERASHAAEKFNERNLRGFEIKELQADELYTFVRGKKHATWLFAIVEVWSRLWPSSVLGRRSYRNTETLFEASRQQWTAQAPLSILTVPM